MNDYFNPLQIRFGRLLAGAQQIRHQNINDTWLGEIYLNSGESISAFVKKLKPRSILVEWICAVTGILIGLPIPEPFLVQATSEELPEDIPENESRILFGSFNVEMQNMIIYGSDKAYQKVINEFKDVGRLGCFDEWIINEDRHEGNILYNGVDYWFIDHEQSLPMSAEYNHRAHFNCILKHLSECLQETEKTTILDRVVSSLVLEVEKRVQDNFTQSLENGSHLDLMTLEEMIGFLKRRISVLYILVEDRLKFQQTKFDL